MTEERLAVVRQSIAEGLSWAQIGERLHCSKNAISGIVRRHIYGKRNNYRNPARADVPQKEYSREKKAKVPPAPAQIIPALPPPPPPLPVTECQWPVNGKRPWRFCTQPTEPGLSYCEKHCRKAYPHWPRAAA